jgi:hypothetical protein
VKQRIVIDKMDKTLVEVLLLEGDLLLLYYSQA